MKKTLSVLLLCCMSTVLLSAAVTKSNGGTTTSAQAIQRITDGYKKHYRKGIYLKVTQDLYYGNTPYLSSESGLFIGCMNNECWPYGKKTYEDGKGFLNTDKVQADFSNNQQVVKELQNADDCLGKEYMGGILPQDRSGINTNTVELESFEDTPSEYKFTFKVSCTTECVGCSDKTESYVNKETRVYDKKHFFPVQVTIENGNAVRKITYKKAL